MLLPLLITVAGGIVLFFVLPMLEKPRDKFLRWIGVRKRGIALKEERLIDSDTKQREGVGDSEKSLPPRIDPLEIIKTIESAPLLQQLELSKHYVGLRIECEGDLGHIEMRGEQKARIFMTVWPPSGSLSGRAHIHFIIDIGDYPGLGLLKYKDHLKVSGIIENANAERLTLKDVKIISYGT